MTHEDLKNYLLSTGDKNRTEANGKETYFSIGLPLTHPDVLDATKWVPHTTHSNHLGEVLMEIRQELRTVH